MMGRCRGWVFSTGDKVNVSKEKTTETRSQDGWQKMARKSHLSSLYSTDRTLTALRLLSCAFEEDFQRYLLE